MAGLFPMLQPELAEGAGRLPLCREMAWNFAEGKPIFLGGRPRVVEGEEAVKVWIWKALTTERARYPIYTWAFGNEVETLMGQQYSEELKKAEAARYVREALETNPYITQVREILVDFAGDTLRVRAVVGTMYGEVDIDV